MGGKRLKFPKRRRYVPEENRLGKYNEETKKVKESDKKYLKELAELQESIKKRKKEKIDE
tara:strand:- start:2670 stop:2849 length:180 start_codon:yes stop_codon:yes gene_type:complete